jgi:hypothetical protein
VDGMRRRHFAEPGVSHGDTFRFSLTPPGAPSTVVEVRIAIR